MPLLDQPQIRHLIPHAGSMCLLDAVLDWDATTIRCRARSHRDPQHPLRANNRLAALHLIEYGAQAMAVHGGLLARQHGREAPPGMLVGVRGASFEVDRIDNIDSDLEVRASQRVASGNGWLYDFEVDAGGQRLAQGRVSVIPTRSR